MTAYQWTLSLVGPVSLRRIAAVCSTGFLLLGVTAPAAVNATGLADCESFGISTEEDFLTQGPVPPDGNPIISDGDLLSITCAICARNSDLLESFEVDATVDLGLDAVDVVTDGQDFVAAFSTELDSPTAGQFTAGDLLATNGTVIPNVVLTSLFPIGHDIGLDGLQFIGDPEDILAFLNEAAQIARAEWIADPQILIEQLNHFGVDIWFSTEGTAPSPASSGFLDGDVLSAYLGIVVLGNALLLPASVPAGLPVRGVDFGLDALGSDRQGSLASIVFSTEIGSSGQPEFGDQDLVGYQTGVRASGSALVHCFEPKSNDFGVDAVVPEPGRQPMLVAGFVLLGLLARRRAAILRPLHSPG